MGLVRQSPLVATLFASLAGCGVESPPPQSPDSQASEAAFTRGNSPATEDFQADMDDMEGAEDEDEAEVEQSESAPEEASEGDEGAVADDATPAQAPAASTETTGPSQSPSQILGGPRIAFMINYSASAPKEAAQKSCSEEAGDDLQARAECLREARSEFVADVLRFKKDRRGKWWWYIYRRERGTLYEVSKSQFEFGDETQKSVKLRLVGGSVGQRPLFAGRREAVISVPTESSIELDDPKLGRLVYEAKIGLVTD